MSKLESKVRHIIPKQDQNIVDSKDADGHLYVREILEKKTGTIVYPWKNEERGETSNRTKSVSYAPFAPWNWVIVGGTYVDEVTAESTQLRNRYIAFGLVALTVFAVRKCFYPGKWSARYVEYGSTQRCAPGRRSWAG